jgi:hypothetical protein
MKHTLALFGLASILAACGSSNSPSTSTTTDAGTDAGTDSTPSVTVEQGCTDLAAAYCAKIDACAPFFVTLDYGTDANCRSRFHDQCVANASSPNSGDLGSNFETCASEAPEFTCNQLFADTLPAGCLPVPGKAANGDSCTDSSQCQSAFCAIGSASSCGVCATAPAAGDPCATGGACPDGLTCVTTTGASPTSTCVASGLAGASCATAPCIGNLECFNGVCTALAGAGEACDISGNTAVSCDITNGLFCNPTTSKCVPITTDATLGATCGLSTSTGVLTVCGATAYCKANPMSTSAGVCTLRAADNAPCASDAILGVGPCTPPSSCIGGTCQQAIPSACSAPATDAGVGDASAD